MHLIHKKLGMRKRYFIPLWGYIEAVEGKYPLINCNYFQAIFMVVYHISMLIAAIIGMIYFTPHYINWFNHFNHG